MATALNFCFISDIFIVPSKSMVKDTSKSVKPFEVKVACLTSGVDALT